MTPRAVAAAASPERYPTPSAGLYDERMRAAAIHAKSPATIIGQIFEIFMPLMPEEVSGNTRCD